MRLHRFYINEQLPAAGSYTVLDERLIHQWKNVFRYAAGDEVILFDGRDLEVQGAFAVLAKEKAVIEISQKLAGGWMPSREVCLYAALIKKDNFEWIAEKCTELGVSKIVPVIAERTIKKDINLERLQTIVIEASEQSERGSVPVVAEPITLADALAETAAMKRFVCARGERASDDASIAKTIGSELVALFTGPEGGWSPTELELFEQANIPYLSLGNKNLKAETAAIVAVAKVLEK